MNNWSSSIDSLLDKIRLNCIQLTNKHTGGMCSSTEHTPCIQNHLYYINASVYFEIPTILPLKITNLYILSISLYYFYLLKGKSLFYSSLKLT